MTTLTDTDVTALTLWAESRGEPTEGRLAVGCVLRNRVADGRWGDSYTAVCRAPFQFSCWNAGTDANHVALMTLATAIMGGTQPIDAILRECYWLADGVMSGKATDRVGRATHYYAVTMQTPPSWAAGAKLAARVGGHLFFVGVP